jgi:spermidine synthase
MSVLYLAVFLLSAATLVFEIALTRVFSVAQWYHFAFMTVSLALLGLGASGTLLAVFPRLLRRDLATLVTVLCLLFSVSVAGGYLVCNLVPFDSYQIALDGRQIAYFAIYYLSLAVPFFFCGLALATVLATNPEQAGKVYFANLLGSGLGCPAALAMLALGGGEWTVVMASLLGAVAALCLANRRSSMHLAFASALIVILAACALRLPQVFEIRMSPYKSLTNSLRYPGARIAYRGWNAFSRVDVVESEGIRSAPGLSYTYPQSPPPQKGLFTDGDNLSPLTAASPGTDLGFLDFLLGSLPYELTSQPRVLILEPGAGLDVLIAAHGGASQIVAVNSNPLVTSVMRDRYGEYSGGLYSQEGVRVVAEDGRSYLRRCREEFDVIQVSLADGYRPVGSGAYSLSESYLYTTEAFVEYLDHLAPDGMLVVHRWLQMPPSEEVRVLALALTALEKAGVEDPGGHVVALRSLYTAVLLVKRQEFTSEELNVVREFSQEKRFDLVYYGGISEQEVNRYSILDEPVYHEAYATLLGAKDRAEFYAGYPFDVRPPSDDRPFFFHFFRWAQTPEILQALGKTWQPWGGSGYLVLLALLILVLLASLVMVLLPLVLLRGRGQIRYGGRIFLYFLFLGIGYLFVEIPLMQRFILFLSHPVYALATVLFGLLTFSGLGSLVSPRLPLRRVIVGLVFLLACYPLLLPLLFHWLLGLHLALRVAASVAMLAPLGFLMGVPFPAGIRLVGRIAPGLVPWAWAINGCASVLSSILAVMIAISQGFSRVLFAGGLAYALALLVIYGLVTLEAGQASTTRGNTTSSLATEA